MDRRTAELLSRAGLLAPSADNSQPECFTWDGQCLRVHYDAPRVAGKTFDPGSPATLLSIGAVLENMLEVCRHCQLDPTVNIMLPVDHLGDPYATIRAASANEVTSVETLPLFKRHTNRFPYRRDKNISEEVKNQLLELGEDNARLQLVDERAPVSALAHTARQASEIRFQTREIHELLAGSLRYSSEEVEAGDGMDVRTLHLPPGGRAFLRFTSDWNRMRKLNKLGAFKFMAAVDSKLLAQSPMILAVTGIDNPQGAISAGKLLCRAWTQANAAGLAAHPYYVVTDQIARLREGTVPEELVAKAEGCLAQTTSLLGLNQGEALYMLLRVGYPTREAPRSRRLPFERVFTDLTTKPSPD